MKPLRLKLTGPVFIVVFAITVWWAQAWGVSQRKDAGIPDTVTIHVLSQKYVPVTFPHQSHAEMSGDCTTCHHHSPAGETVACSTCHGIKAEPKKDDIPSLKAAYHLQCMKCHRETDIELARCTYCHVRKQTSTKVDKEGSEK